MPRPKQDQDKADEGTQVEVAVNAPTTNPRVSSKGTYQLGGVWYRADGTQITDPKEMQLAHRAMDKAAAEARAKAMLGGGE